MQKYRRLALAAAAAVTVALLPASGAQAAEGSNLVNTAPQVIDPKNPAPAIGTKLTPSQLRRALSDKVSVATQKEHGDAIAQRTGATYNVFADEVDDVGKLPASTRAQPPTFQKCQGALGGKTGEKIINHFEFCSVRKLVINTVDADTGVVKGKTRYVQTVAGLALDNFRGIQLQTSLDSFQREGETVDASILRNDFVTAGYDGPDGSNPACKVQAFSNNPTSQKEWETTDHYSVHEVYDDKSQSYGPDSISRCVVGSKQVVNSTSAKIWETGIRIDSSKYIDPQPSVGRAIFDRVTPVLHYWKSSTKHGEVAEHIETAQFNPAATDPPKAGKAVPGSTFSRTPLSRLYPGWDAAAKARYEKNRKIVQTECGKLTKPGDDYECDEYPFASTYEGAGKDDGNYSIKYVNEKHNGSAGGTLAVWQKGDRILHKDKFYVRILP